LNGLRMLRGVNGVSGELHFVSKGLMEAYLSTPNTTPFSIGRLKFMIRTPLTKTKKSSETIPTFSKPGPFCTVMV
jgi:hypothetical protein